MVMIYSYYLPQLDAVIFYLNTETVHLAVSNAIDAENALTSSVDAV